VTAKTGCQATSRIAGAAFGLLALQLSGDLIAVSQDTGVTAAFQLYERGEFDAAVAHATSLRTPPRAWLAAEHVPAPLSPTVRSLQADAERWIAASNGDAASRRRLVVAALVLEVTYAAARESSYQLVPFGPELTLTRLKPEGSSVPSLDAVARSSLSGSRAQILAIRWARTLLPSAEPVLPAERWWWLASAGVMTQAQGWTDLEEHLGKALARLPGEPRLLLASVLRDARLELKPIHPDPQLRRRPDSLARIGDRTLYRAARGRLSSVERALRELLVHPPLTGDVELHLGYVAMIGERWSEALARLPRARAATTEPFIHAAADYLAGWASERLGQDADALAAYERAHALAPAQRNLSWLLARQLALADRPADAYRVLDGIVHSTRPDLDLQTQLLSGDARLVPEWIVRMREALR
jgi:tetratricopeptide (TPR) repeat protein